MDNQFEQAIDTLQSWVGAERIVEDDIGLTAVRRIAAMLDLDPERFRPGTELPPHWFTMFFADNASQADLGADGHPKSGLFLPPIPLPRRMGAGRRMTIAGRLRAAQAARKIAKVMAITPKTGRSGRIAVLTMRHTIETARQVIAVDEFDAIYREAVPAGKKSTATTPATAPVDGDWTVSTQLSETLVFRYSAVTWNAHRIHYDADYARDQEGYAHTIQNGGLTMQLMIDGALARETTRALKAISARLTFPLYVGDSVTVSGKKTAADRMECWASDKNGVLCGQMSLEFGEYS